VQCATPYPLMLRETIKQVLNQSKNANPNHFVKVNVDTNKMCLKVWKRPMLAEGDTSRKIWSMVGSEFPIPLQCLDLYARKVPDDFKVTFSVADPDPDHDSDMESELDSGPSQQASAKQKQGTKSPARRGSSDSQRR
jgi:hypothetical protein